MPAADAFDLARRLLGGEVADAGAGWIRTELPALTACLRLNRNTKAHVRYALGLGSRLWPIGCYPQAETAYRAARGLSTPDTVEHALAVQGLGRVARIVGEYGTAKELLNQAIDNFHRLGDLLEQAVSLRDLAETVRSSGDPKGSADLSAQALELFRRIGDRDGEADALVV